jgi:hypothetical protein
MGEQADEGSVPTPATPPPIVAVPRIRVLYDGRVLALGMEEYLRGVVPAEMDFRWDAQALQVQAVCARTYALYQLRTGGNHPRANYDVCALEHCQAYYPLDEHRDTWNRSLAGTDAAIRATEGEVVVMAPDSAGDSPVAVIQVRGGRLLIKAEFSDDCGGDTNVGTDVIERGPFLTGVDCPDKDRRGDTSRSHGRGVCQRGAQRFATDAQAQARLPGSSDEPLYRRILRFYYANVEVLPSYGET